MRMSVRCFLGWHGPYWNTDESFMGPYSHRTEEGFVRVCPQCGTRWQGCVVDKNVGYGVKVMTFGPWVKEGRGDTSR